MKKFSMVLVWVLLCGATAFAQMRVPAPSPAASTSQVIGATKVSIEYSAPGVKGREIWGGLQPYDKVWRAGANAATAITFQDDVTFAGKDVKAGTYSLFVTPKKDGDWSVYLDPSGKSVFDYGQDEAKIKEAAGVIMASVAPKMMKENKEFLAYHINLLNQETAHLVLRWEKLMLPMEIKVNTIGVAQKSIEGQLNNWYTYANVAKFYVDNNLDLDKAQAWVENSVKLQDHFYNKWVMALVMSKKGETKEAVKYAKAAKAFGDENPSNFYNAYKNAIETSLKEWK